MARITLVCLLSAACCLAPGVARAQDLLDVKSARLLHGEFLADLEMVRAKIDTLAKAIPADRYTWRPTSDVRSVSQVLMHVAGEWYVICAMSVGATLPAGFDPPGEAMRKLETVTAKEDVLEHLTKSWAFCRSVLNAADPAKLLGTYEPAKMSLARAALRVAGDQHEHLGQLITYARSVGVKPPWTR